MHRRHSHSQQQSPRATAARRPPQTSWPWNAESTLFLMLSAHLHGDHQLEFVLSFGYNSIMPQPSSIIAGCTAQAHVYTLFKFQGNTISLNYVGSSVKWFLLLLSLGNSNIATSSRFFSELSYFCSICVDRWPSKLGGSRDFHLGIVIQFLKSNGIPSKSGGSVVRARAVPSLGVA